MIKFAKKIIEIITNKLRKNEPAPEIYQEIQNNKCAKEESISEKHSDVKEQYNECSKENLNEALAHEGQPTLSEEQLLICQQLDALQDNFFVTGKAGTGKSLVLKYFRQTTRKNIVVLAPTGIAAINVKGQTIHSFFEIDPGIQFSEYSMKKNYKPEKERLIQELDAVVIDEISMVRADVMDSIDLCLQAARKKQGVPFGGCQIIVFGDLYQLPPVDGNNEEAKRYILDTYGTKYFFGAPGIRQKPCKILELTHVYRQSESSLIDLLNNIRVGKQTLSTIAQLNELCYNSGRAHNGVVITPWKARVKHINQISLSSLPGDICRYHANAFGSFVNNGKVDEQKVPTEYILQLKPGAKVMLLNNDRNKNWVNGTLAEVKEASENKLIVCINGQNYPVEKHIWEDYTYHYDPSTGKIDKKVSGIFEQYPVRLAYAITIHKAQGQTYDKVAIDYGNGTSFACGQTYVALSRCRSLDGLWFKSPLKYSDIKIDDEITRWLNFYQNKNLVSD